MIKLTDEELVKKIVRQQLYQIQLQKQYRDNPLANPPLTKAERKRSDAEWQEALKRNLHHEIHDRISGKIGGGYASDVLPLEPKRR